MTTFSNFLDNILPQSVKRLLTLILGLLIVHLVKEL